MLRRHDNFARLIAPALLALTTAVTPSLGKAQQTGRVVRIGMLNAAVAPPLGVPFIIGDAVRGRLRELGYVEGKTLLVDTRWGGGNYDQLPELARELVRGRPDVIVVIGSKTAEVALDATSTIPIVAITCEPFPFIEALARHGRNLTGVTCMSSAHRERAGGLFVHPDVLIGQQRARIAEFALRHRLPAVEPFGAFPDAGGLMSYGSNLTDMSRRAAEQTDRLLKGAKVADLPVEQATRFYLIVNLKTAKALGVTIPPSILLLTDRLIE